MGGGTLPTTDGSRKAIVLIWLAQFFASLLTLALPPFYAIFIPKAFPGAPAWLAGVVFAAPLITSAGLAPFWGRLGDRFGRLKMGIRAQLGLAIALFLAGSARSGWEFLAALLLQGALGGAYSANRAILLERIHPSQRTRALEHLETAPRIALVLGPLAFSCLGESVLKPSLLKLLAPLGLLSVVLILFLRSVPVVSPQGAQRKSQLWCSGGVHVSQEFRRAELALFTLFIGGGIFAPYAVLWTLHQVRGISILLATALALLPNMIFSGFVLFRRSRQETGEKSHRLPAGLVMQALALMVLVLCIHDFSQLITRLGYSVFFVLNWCEIHRRVVRVLPEAGLGHAMGRLDAVQRWAALSGGAISALLGWMAPAQTALPFLAGALMLGLVFFFTLMERGTHVDSLSRSRSPLFGKSRELLGS